MNESNLQRVFLKKTYPGDSKVKIDVGFVNIDNGSQGGTHWVCFIIKDKKNILLWLIWWSTR